MKTPRWTTVAESEFPWEREALDWLREQLPDSDPWHAWSNFEFIDDDGKVNEVDLLVLAPGGLFLVEIKSRPGVLTGDTRTWTWLTDGREYSYDNPLYLANRKAKRLASLLRRQPSFVKSRERMPWVEPAIFLSSTTVNCKLEGLARTKSYTRGRPGKPEDDGIVAALYATPGAGPAGTSTLVDRRQGNAITRALVDLGIRPSVKHRRVGDYQLDALLADGINFQDWAATHTSVSATRRVRVYGYGKAATIEARAALARQARREFAILEGVESSGVVKVLDYKDTELGPALVFEYDPKATRLDHYLQQRGDALDIGTRLQLIRDLSETLAYAHKKRLFHRALTPASILIRETGDPKHQLRVQVTNWQTAAREGSEGGSTLQTTGTLHVDDYVDDPGRVYLAPEAMFSTSASGPSLDVFSLGAIAHLILSGKPPAADAAELSEKLRQGRGLHLSDALDGSSKGLQDLVEYATLREVSMRLASVNDFIEYLDAAEEELTAPDPEHVIDPSLAKSNDRVAGGFSVVRRLGRTASSDVLLVKRDGSDEELVLKVAIDPRENDRLTAEGETLRRLRHQNVVEFRALLEIAGRTALLMRKAGDRILASRLREEGRLSLDLLRRFGQELLEALDYLEQEGVAHRDIKPDNIGIAPVGEKGMLHLVLFDFSLSRASAENIKAGTRGYLDPFLSLRHPPRWDLYAERFSAGVTLYEMATGTLPVWGDGQSAPDLLDCEVSLSSEAFDPYLRDGLASFFDKALRRNFRERFDNAEEMLRAWRRIFDQAQQSTTLPDALEAIAVIANQDTTIGDLGFSVDAQNVLERMGIHKLTDLLGVDRVRFRYLSSVGDKVRKEIRGVAKRLAQLRPDLVPGRATLVGDEEIDAGPSSIDELAAQLLPKRPAGDDRPDERAVALYLGLEPADALGAWPALGGVARDVGMPRNVVAEALVRVRERWLKSPQMTAIREDIVRVLDKHAGVMTVDELAAALLAERGSAEQDEDLRRRLARAVLRAGIEAEQAREEQRIQTFGREDQPLVARNPQLAEYAVRLGDEADRIALEDPLMTPLNAMRALELIDPPSGELPLTPQRMLRLAVAASRRAALSSRSEIYPVEMAILQATKHSLGALVGPKRLSEADIAARIRGRYPNCAPLPPRPALDSLLTQSGAALIWQEGDGGQPPGYVPLYALGPSVGSTTYVHRHPTEVTGPTEVTEGIAEARAFEEKLEYLLQHGGFLALTTQPRLSVHVQREITSRFRVNIESLDDLLINAMLAQAAALQVDWNTVLKADRAPPDSTDGRNLRLLTARAGQAISMDLAKRSQPVLLSDPGLLARYDLMSVVVSLQASAGRPGNVPAVFLLVPMTTPGTPSVDNVVVPVVAGTQWARVPNAWVMNAHRAGVSSGG